MPADAPPAFRLVTLGRLALLRPDGSEEPTLRTQTRKLALLAYVALADRPLSRDHLADVFWGDRDDERARHSLREALSHLRRVLGTDAIARRSTTVSLADDAPLVLDAREFDAACARGAPDDALARYPGPFLDGVFVNGSHRFDEWSSIERARRERRFVAASADAWRDRHAAGDLDAAVAIAEGWLAAAPESADAACALLASLAAPGTVDALRGAREAYDRLARRLQVEHDAHPDPRVDAAVAEIDQRLASAPAAAAPVPRSTPVSAAPPALVAPAGRPPRRAPAFAGAALVLALGALALPQLRRPATAAAPVSDAPPALVVASFDVGAAPADAWLRDGAPQLVGAALARESAVEVVDPGRLRDAVRRGRYGDDGRLATDEALDVARRLGAAWLVTGAVTHGGAGYLVDVSLRELPGGRVHRRVQVADTGIVTAVARVAAGLLPVLDARASAGARFEDIETRSTEAYRAFARAQTLTYEGRYADAVAALDEAIAADSDFASAVVERRRWIGGSTSRAAYDTARRLTTRFEHLRERASAFDRMDTDALDAFARGDHERAEALARALVGRFPRDPRAYRELAMILSSHGRNAGALAAIEKSLALDSLGREAGNGPCASCAGYASVAWYTLALGDAARAEAAARRGVALQPDLPVPWKVLSDVLSARERHDEAIAAARQASALAPRQPEYAEYAVRRLIDARRLDEADSVIRTWRVAENGALRVAAADLDATVLRERGQFAAAARQLRGPAAGSTDGSAFRLVLGNTLARLGDTAGAVRAYETAAPHHPTRAWQPVGVLNEAPRAFAWAHALLGDALYLAGAADTLRLLALADSVQVVGARSYFGRDWRLHHHLRGLVAMRAGRWAEAESHFRQAPEGRGAWTRTVVELARAQRNQGRGGDAVTTLRNAYMGPIDGAGRYAPRSEIDYEMALMAAAAAMPDSARLYADRARRAWRDADPAVRARLDSLPR